MADAILLLTHDLQLALGKGRESRVVSLGLSAALMLLNKVLILKIQSFVVCGKFSAVLSEFIFDKSHYVVFEFKGHLWYPQSSVLGTLLFTTYTYDTFSDISSNVIA